MKGIDLDGGQKKVVKLDGVSSLEIRRIILSAGNTIGSVHFFKRTDSSLRKMSYRLHVKNPSFASKPIGVVNGNAMNSREGVGSKYTQFSGYEGVTSVSKTFVRPFRKEVDWANNQMTVFDNNKVLKRGGKVLGRGQWRTIPLERVVQIQVRGVKYIVKNIHNY